MIRFSKLALASALALGLLVVGSVVNDRGGFVRLGNILDVGREYLPLRSPAKAAQGSGCMPTTGTVSGLTFAQDVNSAIAALISSNSGSSAPATDCSAAAIKGQFWLDTSVTPNVLKQYDGTSWVFLGALDSSNHLWAPPMGGGTATIASATTTDIWSNAASSITISGTTTVTALANASAVPGTVKIVTASGAFTLTHNATSLILPSGANITTAAGDNFLAFALTSTNVAVFAYTRADGSAVVNPSVPIGTVLYGDYGTIPVKSVYGYGQALARASYPGYLAAATRAQSATLTAGNNTITSVGNTAGLGAGMPLEGTGIQSGTTISSVTSSTIVMSKTASANGSQTVTAFITGYGSGGDSTTIGVRDCRGRAMAGRDDMGGTPASRLTSSYFGASGSVIGNVGGLESVTMAAANIYQHYHDVFLNDPGHTHSFNAFTLTGPQITGSGGVAIGLNGSTTGSNVTGITVRDQSGGLGTANRTNVTGSTTPTPMRTVPPTSIAECVVVVLP